MTTAAHRGAEPAVVIDGYTGDYAHDHALHRERGFAFFAPPGDEGTEVDVAEPLALALQDKRLFDLATWHAEIAPLFRRAREAREHAEHALERLARCAELPADDNAWFGARAAAGGAVAAYGCARSNLLVAVDRNPLPARNVPLYERYVAEDTRVRPDTLVGDGVLRTRLQALSPA